LFIAAETDQHEGKRKAEALWPIFRIHHQRSRYIYDLFYKRRAISRGMMLSMLYDVVWRQLLVCPEMNGVLRVDLCFAADVYFMYLFISTRDHQDMSADLRKILHCDQP